MTKSRVGKLFALAIPLLLPSTLLIAGWGLPTIWQETNDVDDVQYYNMGDVLTAEVEVEYGNSGPFIKYVWAAAVISDNTDGNIVNQDIVDRVALLPGNSMILNPETQWIVPSSRLGHNFHADYLWGFGRDFDPDNIQGTAEGAGWFLGL